MQSIRGLIIASAGIFLATLSSAQTITGSETKKADVNFTELSNYYQEHPMSLKRRLPFDEDEETEHADNPEPDPSEVHMLNRSAARLANPGGTPSYLPVSTAAADTFLSTVSNGTNIPPDTHGAVSPEYCMTVVNSEFHIHNRKGKGILTIPINGFWTSILPAGTDPFDPKIVYDPYYKRWVLVTDAVNQTSMTSSTLLIGVSATCNPTGSWHLFSITIDPTDAAWLDYPNIGFNTRWVTITGNMFANTMGGATGAVVYVVNYANMMSGTGAPFTKISQSGSFTLCPAVTQDATLQNMFLMEVSSGNSGKLRLWKIDGPTSAPVMSSVGYPATTGLHWKSSGPGGNDFVRQLGTANKLDAGDNRIHRLTFRNNKLWCAHTIFLPTSGATRCSIMWWQIDTLANPIQNGIIDDPATPSFYFYPSIAVNANDDALIGFSYSNSLIYPSCAYALRMSADPLDSMRPFVVYRQGQTNYFQNFGGGKNRWGDYSAAVVDPINDIDFWTIQESVPSSPANYWDTWWAHIQLSAGTPGLSVAQNPTYSYSPDSIKFTGIISPGTIATWSFGGGTVLPGSGTGNQDAKWTTPGTVVVKLTDSVPGCTLVFTDTVVVLATSAVKPVIAADQHIQIVPNPSSGVFDILFENPVTEPANIKLIDMQGRIVYAHQFIVTDNKASIQANNLPSGIYVVNIDINNNVVTKKITIDK